MGLDEVKVPIDWLSNHGRAMCVMTYFGLHFALNGKFIVAIGNNWEIVKNMIDKEFLTHDSWIHRMYGNEKIMFHCRMVQLHRLCMKVTYGRKNGIQNELPGFIKEAIETNLTNLDYWESGLKFMETNIARGLNTWDSIRSYYIDSNKKKRIWFGVKPGLPEWDNCSFRGGMLVIASTWFNKANEAHQGHPEYLR
jgi:hypothetical protein